MIRTGANLLVIGTSDSLATFGSVCSDEFRQPVVCTSSATFDLRIAPTMILLDVQGLDGARQLALKEWLSLAADAKTQVVSLAAVPLFPLVQAGRFDASLYYRLNTIYLELEAEKLAFA